MKPRLLAIFPIFPILFLIADGQSGARAIAQTPQRDNRPRTASIGGRVTIGGKPAVNAVITVAETDLKPDAGELDLRIPFKAKARTDADGRYLVGGLAEGRYVINAMLNAFVAADSSSDPSLSRTLTLDEGEAREKVDFTLIRGGVLTGRVMDDEGAPLIAQRVQLYTVNAQGQKRDYRNFIYEMAETDDRGVYRIYGLPPERYIISAGGGGKFARTYYPDTTDEKQAKVIEIKEGSEVADVDIRFGSARKTYEAAGRVVDRETGKPIPRIYVSCRSKPEKDGSNSGYSKTAIADGQGNFNFPGLTPGLYQAWVMDVLSEEGYRSESAEFEIMNDNVSGVEVKVFLGASVSGFVVIEGADAAARKQHQSMTIYSTVTPPSDATGNANERSSVPQFPTYTRVNPDGSFTIKGLQAGSASFSLSSFGNGLRIRRIERDGVEVKDAIEVRPGERITGLRIVAFQPQGRIRGQVQIVGGALPDGWQLQASASRATNADGSKESDRAPVAADGRGGYAFVDAKGRFVIEGLPAGEYDLFISTSRRTKDGRWESVNLPGLVQRVAVRENDETSVTIPLDLNRVIQPKNQEGR